MERPYRVAREGPRWLRPVMGTRRRRIVTYTITMACAAVAGVLLVSHNNGSAPPRARLYLSFSACLLTGSRGLAGSARPCPTPRAPGTPRPPAA